VAGPVRTWDDIEKLFRRASSELQRGARAAAIAANHERLLRDAPPPSRELHARMAEIHRQLGQRHLTSARLHRSHADRLRIWVRSGQGKIAPVFMSAVADTSGVDSAVLHLFGRREPEALVAASDETATAAHELEATLGEGPARDAAAGRELVAAWDDAIEERWPLYGPAIAGLGIRAAAAAPLGMPSGFLGTLTVFDLRRSDDSISASLGAVADALTHSVLLADDLTDDIDAAGPDTADGVHLPLPEAAGRHAVVHQAVGMVAGQRDCSTADALAIIQAHAFAQSEAVEAVAAKVVGRKLRLVDDP
jgi:hypothetical protein